MTTRKSFTITAGRGFQIKCPNGYTVSVQFGVNNYCENRRWDMGSSVVVADDMHFMSGDLKAGQEGSDTAETAIIGPDGEFVPYDPRTPLGFPDDPEGYDGVQARMTVDDVMIMLARVYALPPQPRRITGIAKVAGELVNEN